MRVYAVVLIVALVASAQCISACTIASCIETQQRNVPPCHKHGVPPQGGVPQGGIPQGGIPMSSHHHGSESPDSPQQQGQACDHQKTADEARWAALDLYFFDVLTDSPSMQVLSNPGLAEPSRKFESPPPLVTPSSVLRI
jgi:hypothetical protein